MPRVGSSGLGAPESYVRAKELPRGRRRGPGWHDLRNRLSNTRDAYRPTRAAYFFKHGRAVRFELGNGNFPHLRNLRCLLPMSFFG